VLACIVFSIGESVCFGQDSQLYAITSIGNVYSVNMSSPDSSGLWRTLSPGLTTSDSANYSGLIWNGTHFYTTYRYNNTTSPSYIIRFGLEAGDEKVMGSFSDNISQLAINASGDVWAVDVLGSGVPSVLRTVNLSAMSLGTAISLSPDDSLAGSTTFGLDFFGLTFDSSGNLWASAGYFYYEFNSDMSGSWAGVCGSDCEAYVNCGCWVSPAAEGLVTDPSSGLMESVFCNDPDGGGALACYLWYLTPPTPTTYTGALLNIGTDIGPMFSVYGIPYHQSFMGLAYAPPVPTTSCNFYHIGTTTVCM